MAVKSPIRYVFDGDGNIVEFSEFQAADFIGISDGGTGATTALGASQALGLEVGVDVQAYDINLDQLAALNPTDSNFIVGNGSEWVVESGSTVRDSLGLGTSDDVQFNTILTSNLTVSGPSIALEGATDDAFETTLLVTDPTADRTITFPDATGTVLLDSLAQTITNKTIDYDDNTIQDFELGAFKASVIVTEAEGIGSNDSDTQIATTAAIIDYVGAQLTLEDLDFAGDTGTGAVDLDSQSLTIAGTANEIETSASGQTLTIGLPDDVTITNNLTVDGTFYSDDITAASISATGDVTITGNLTVQGSTTSVESNTVTIGDAILELNADETGAPSANAGLTVNRGTSTNVDLLWDEANDRWTVGAYDFVAANFIGDLTGTADVADALSSAVTVELTGDVTGSATFTNAGDTASIAATIQANSVALGTDTTGNYVEDISAGDGLSTTGTASEGQTPTLSVNVDDSSIEIDTDILQVKALGVTNAMLAGSIENAKLTNSKVVITDGTTPSDLNLGDTLTFTGGTGVTITNTANTLDVSFDAAEVKADLDEYAQDAVIDALTSGTQTRITVGYDDNGDSISLTVDDDLANYDNTNTAFIDLTDLSVATGSGLTYNSATGEFGTSAIPNSQLENSSVTINANALSLGGTLTLVTDDIQEDGSPTNLWYTDARVGTYLTANSYATETYVDNAVASENEISEMNDVTLTSLASGEYLRYNGTAWVNSTLNADIDARVTKTFIDALNVDADTLDGIDSTGFATSAQGTLADSALQSGDNITELTNNANYIDLTDISVTDSGGDGSLSYDNTTGVITYTGPSQAEVLAHISGGTGITVSGAGVIATTITQYADSDVEAYLSGGTGVSFSSGVISIGQAVGTTDNVTFNNVTVDGVLNSDDITATTMTVSNDLVVTGDLTVQGTTTTLNTDTVSTEENMIKLASGNTGNSTDIGIYGKVVQSSTTKYVGLHWDPGVGQNKFKLFDSLTVEPTGTVDTADASYTKATLVANIEGDVTGALTGNADTATSLASGQNFSLTGDVTATAISFDGTGAVALSTTVTESAVTQHEAALTITESQISDLQSYLTAETNDLTSAVTWANVPDANITQSSVTQHQAALAINESQITFTSNFLENLVEDLTPQLGGTLDANGNTIDMGVNVITDTKVGQWDTAYGWGDHSLAGYLTSETSHADVLVDGDFTTAGIMATDGSGTYSIVTDNSTNWNTAYSWGDHSAAGYLTSFTETNDLTAAVTWANVPDANITESSVTQHEAALSITESQISDLGSYITATSSDTLTNKTINFEDNTAIIEFAVTVSNPGAGNKYYLDGELSANIQLIPGVTYRFDQSDSSNSTHPLVFSTTSESAGVTSYTTGVTQVGTPGSAGAYTQIVVDGATADKLYYYCSSHSGMGGGIVSIQGSSFVAGTGISISGETISSTITQYADSDVEAYLSGGTGVTFSSGVISIGQAVGTSDNVTFNDVTVSGDLIVSGTTTTINTETIELADNIIVFNSNATGSASQDAGIEIERGDDANKTLIWNETDDKWTVGSETFVAGTFEGNLTGDVTGDVDGAIILSGKNETGSTIGAGVPVYISGQSGSGTEFTVAPADADGSGTMPAIGITTASANNNAAVSILTFGKFVGLDTSSFSVGDSLYVSTSGTLVNTPPTGESSLLQKIAKVTRSHASDGAIFVQGAGRSNAVPNLDDGDIFIGNASNQAVSASFNTTVDGYLSGGTGIDYTSGTISVDSTAITGQSALAGSVDTANDFVLLYDDSSTSLTKVDVATLLASAGSGSFNDFNLTADTGTPEVVADGNTVTIAGGTGIDTVVSTTDTVTVSIDNTVITTSSSIGDLSDVDITTSAPTDGQALVWNASNSEFEPGTVASSTNYFQTIAVSGQSDVVPDSTTDTLNFAAGSNITITTDASTDTITIASTDTNTQLTQEQVEDFVDGLIVAGANITKTYDDNAGTLTIAATGGAANAFSTLAVAGQSNVVADSETDTLTLTAGTGMTITTDASTDTITFTSAGGGGGSLPVILAGSTSDPITLSDITVAGAIPFTSFDGTTDNIQLGSTQTAVTTFADNDADTSIELERTSDDDTVYIKAGGTDVVTATSSGVTITNLTVTGTTTQANELKITDTLFELNADGGSLTTDAGMIIERGSTGDNAAFIWDESADAFVVGTTATDGSAATNLTVTEATLKAATQSQGDNSTNVATTAYVDTATAGISSDTVTDADGDTLIEVENSDADEIVMTTAGQERLKVDNNVSMSARGGFFTHQLTMDSNETFTIASTEGTVAAGPLDIQGTVDVQGSLVVL